MKIKLKCSILIAVVLLILLSLNKLSIKSYSTPTNTISKVIKVGVYEYEPYVYLDKNGKIKGYYNDFLNLIREKYGFNYEYVLCTIADGIEKLEAGDIDIMLGLPIVIMESRDVIFNRKSISNEQFGLFSAENLTVSDLKSNNKLRLGLVEADYNAEWIIKFFELSNIDIEVVYGKDYKELEKLIKEDKIDLMADNAYKRSQYNIIYRFAGEQVYIAGNKESSYILRNIDKVIEEYEQEKNNPLIKLNDKYFNEEYSKNLTKKICLFIFLLTLVVILTIVIIIPKIKKLKIKNKIKNRINNDKYFLQYQPICNPRTRNIVGFEGLLRLVDENNKIIPPYKFIAEIEQNDMLFDISLWILKKAIEDYFKIKNFNCVRKKQFYISINLSLNEIENEMFVKKAIEILHESNLKPYQICLEIIERVKVNDFYKINKNINILKDAGFKIAIDDFGVEYSNLDILQNLDADVVKVDKNFVDGIGTDIIKNEIVLFISKIAKSANKSVVLEGIEKAEQDIEIKKIENDLLYAQGYYYNKPMNIEDIGKL